MFDRSLVAVRHPFLPIFLAILAFFVWAYSLYDHNNLLSPVWPYVLAVILVEAGAWALYSAVDQWHRGLMTPSFDRKWQHPRHLRPATNGTMSSMSFILGGAIFCSILAVLEASTRDVAGWYLAGTLIGFVATACVIWFVIDWLARSGSDGGTLIPTNREEPVLSLPRLHAT